ncbi:UNVERIFIED_CONTAM: hypothetical protein FKN15_048418 [Acipenser sinensis]
MASNISELEAAKKNLSEALGENIKQYWANLKLWFKQKISKEEFDTEARRLLSQDNVHFHNDFLLAILTRCQIMVSVPEGAGSLPWAGGSACKPGKPKGKKKFSSVRQKFDHRFQSLNPLSAAQPLVSKDPPEEEEEVRLSAHTLLLPSRGQLEARMMVTAFELGLDNVSEDAVSTLVCAVEACTLQNSPVPSLVTHWKHEASPPSPSESIRQETRCMRLLELRTDATQEHKPASTLPANTHTPKP